MPFSGIVDNDQLAMRTKVLDDYCAAHRIELSSPDRLNVSYLIMSLYEKGVDTAEELKAALAAWPATSARPEA